MLTLEQYRNGEMAALYLLRHFLVALQHHNCIAAGPVKAPL